MFKLRYVVSCASLAYAFTGTTLTQAQIFGTINVGQSSSAETTPNMAGTLPITQSFVVDTPDFPGLAFVPFTSVYYVTGTNTNGDRLLVGNMSLSAYSQFQQLPYPTFVNEQFCGSVQLAPGQYYSIYVPSPDERLGNFSPFAGLLIDPNSNLPYAGGIIPTSVIPTVFAWRIAPGPATLPCLETFVPQHPGWHDGALVAEDTSGNWSTTFLTGEGVGPQIAFTPGIVSTLLSGSNTAYSSVATDANGYLYVADTHACAIRKVNPNSKAAIIIAGTGSCLTSGNGSGDGGAATSAQFTAPQGIAVDPGGNVYVIDNHVVRQINAATGLITRVAGLANGNGGADSGDGGLATSANLSSPKGIATDHSGNLYIAESSTDPATGFTSGGEVRQVLVGSNTIYRYAGTGVTGFLGGQTLSARLGSAVGIAFDSAENLYIADPYNSVVWIVDTTGISVYAGTGLAGHTGDGGPATSAQLNAPTGLAIDLTNNLYIAEAGSNYVRMVNATTGVITTIAGNGSTNYSGDGSLSTSTGMGQLVNGADLAVDAAGNLYVSSATGVLRIAQNSTSVSFPASLSSQTQSFTLWNEGNAALDLSSGITITGSNSGDFSQTNNCGASLAAGNSCTLSVTYAPSGGANTATLNIGNQTVPLQGASPTNEQIKVYIDNPGAPNIPYLGRATFSGWAIDNVSSPTITILVDGAVIGTTTDMLARPDVCNAFPAQVGCPVVGWSFTFDTSGLSSGTHTLEVRASSQTGKNAAASNTFTVANWSGTATNPIRVWIDAPSSSSGSFSGTANFGGWAVDDAGAIGNVLIAIDGVSYGNAIYGGNRTDVCIAFPNRQGCPNVGWNFSVDTTTLADGMHTLAVTATSTAGAHAVATASFTVANQTSQNPLRVDIDTPNAQSPAFSGSAHFGGWALDTTAGASAAITTVRVSVDGMFVANAIYGGIRSDVCGVFSGATGCPAVGWDYVLDTTQFANGPHMLEVTAVTLTGQQATVASGFTISNSVANNPTRVFIDVPSGQAILAGTPTLSGWAENDSSPISNVSVYIDANLEGTANYSTSRPDVCAVFPNGQGCPNVGWNFVLDTTALPNGTHTVAVSATAANGQKNIVSNMFTVANWTAVGNPFHIQIDAPSSSSSPLTGSAAHIGGWAINANAPVTNVAIGVDGIPVGTAIYGGTRGDVCAVFPNAAGCPDVGWNFLLDTSVLADGSHTLDVTAMAGGESYTVSGSFKVSNLGTPSGIQMSIDTPSATSSPFSGTAAFGGWAISANGAISTVAIYVDGTLDGNATYGGNGGVRNDVCAAFPNAAGCPMVGWNYLIDTTKYSNGVHMLEVTATDATGKRATESATFTVSN